jgi:CBS domain-containing protein
MDVGKLCRHRVVSVGTEADLVEAARLMREHHVGFLVVAEEGVPVGVITDRDIVLEVVAADVSGHDVTVGDTMTAEPLTLTTDSPLDDALESMRAAGVRRVPVVDDRGRIAGVLSIDDLLEHLAGQLGAVAGSLRHEQAIERLARP